VKLRVGLMLPYTGTFAALGTAITQGFHLAVDENGGKLGGRDLLRVGDIGDQGYDLLAVSPARDLVIDGPDVDSGQVGYLHQAAAEPVGVLCFLS